jgi:predicted N-acetyltransferase YhbS
MEVITTGSAVRADRESAVAFLRREGYSHPIQSADSVFAAWVGSEVIGAVRLADEDGVLVLRGMRVREDMRRRGIGRRILGCLDTAIGQTTCWCIPYGWLTGFYATIRFTTVAPGDAVIPSGTPPTVLSARP